MLEFSQLTNRFEKLVEEIIGKTGCRRSVPGEYLVTDSYGRAAMIGSIDRSKIVYQISRD